MLRLEKRHIQTSASLKPDDIDPYTIFLGNIHPSTSIQSVKQKVPKAYRVDVGFAKKHKHGRYAFAKFRVAADAREAFVYLSQMTNNEGGMDLVVRFRRVRGHISMNGDENVMKTLKAVNHLRNDDKTEKYLANVMKESLNDTFASSVEKITRSLLRNDTLDWKKLREMQVQKYKSKKFIKNGLPVVNFGTNRKSLSEIPDDSSQDSLDEIFLQMDSNKSSVFDNDLDFC